MGIQDLLTYWKVIKKRLWLIGLLIGATVGTILVLSYTAKPVFGESVLFQGIAPPPEEVTLYSEFRSPSSREVIGYTTSNFIEIVRSEAVAWKTPPNSPTSSPMTTTMSSRLISSRRASFMASRYLISLIVSLPFCYY